MTDTQTTPDALDLTQEVDRLYQEWRAAIATAKRTGTREDNGTAWRAFEAYVLASQRADRAAATFGPGTEGVGG